MSSKRKTLEQWINEALTDPDKSEKCSMMSLVHMVGQQEKEVHTVKFGSGKSWAPNDLATMFRGKAEALVQDIPGVQMFQLLAFYGDKITPEARQPFVVNVSTDFGGLTTEAPNETGRMQQTMRQAEMLFQQTYRRQQVQDETIFRIIDRLSTMNETLGRENMDAYTIVKDMLMEKALNDHNRKMEQLRYERDTGERKKMMTWVPALVNQVLGREIFPQGTADTSLVESITDSLTEEDIMKLASVIKPELMGPLASRMTQYLEKKRREEESIKMLGQMKSPDPEADAAGDIVSVNGKA